MMLRVSFCFTDELGILYSGTEDKVDADKEAKFWPTN